MSPQNDLHVDVQNLTFLRGERKIFDDLSLQIQRGKITAIMGPSGTGKTTLLKLIGGQLRPESGSIFVDGSDVHLISRRALFALRAKMGMLFQSGALFTDMSVAENVAFPLRVHTNLTERVIEDLVLMKLNAVGLRGAFKLRPAELSGGMARRAALARAIALDPEMLMYDEPFAGQDPIAMGVLINLISRLNKALGHTSVIVSHDIQETLSIADYVYLISDGKVLAQGAPSELKASGDPRVIQFMEGQPDGPVPFHYPAPSFKDQLFRGVEK